MRRNDLSVARITLPLLLVGLVTFGLTFFTQPSSAVAQEKETVLIDLADCAKSQRQSTASPKTEVDLSQTKQITENFLLNAFTYQTLSERLRCDPLIVGTLDETGAPITTSIYKTAQNLVNFGVLIALLTIAFANILPFKMETYSVKKAVPMLVLGVILANLALPAIRTMVDFSGVLSATFISAATPEQTRTAFVEELVSTVYKGGAAATGNAVRGIATGNGGINSAILLVGFGISVAGATGPFFVAILVGVLFLILLPTIVFLYLGLLFVARIYVLVILTAVSPIAFASIGFEPLKGKVWTWWWKQFMNWTFMAPATFFLMWISVRFYQAVNRQPDIGTYILTLALLYLAAQIPTKMGGSIMGKWNEMFAAPLKNLALKPFGTARDYVQKGVPRDLSRFASARGINVVRSVKEGMAEIEHLNAEKEARSKSVFAGKRIGRVAANFLEEGLIHDPEYHDAPWWNVKKKFQIRAKLAQVEARREFMTSSEGQEVMKRVKNVTKDIIGDKTPGTVADAYEQELLTKRTRMAGDISKLSDEDLQFAALSHATIGDAENLVKAVKELQKRGKAEISLLNSLSNLYTEQTRSLSPLEAASAQERFKREGNRTGLVNYVKEKYERQIDSASHGSRDRSQELVRQTFDTFRQMYTEMAARDKDGNILRNEDGSIQLRSLNDNPYATAQFEALASTILKYEDKLHPEGQRELDEMRTSLAQANITQLKDIFLHSPSTQAALQRAVDSSAGLEGAESVTEHAILEHIDQLKPQHFSAIPPALQQAMLNFFKNDEQIKQAIIEHLEDTVQNQLTEDEFDRVMNDLKKASIEEIANGTAVNKTIRTKIGVQMDQAERIANGVKTLHDLERTNAVKNASRRVITGGGDTPTSTESERIKQRFADLDAH